MVGQHVSLRAPENEVREDCNWEQDWQAYSVHDCDKRDVQNVGELEVDDVLRT